MCSFTLHAIMTNLTSTKEEQLRTYSNYPHSEGLEEEVGRGSVHPNVAAGIETRQTRQQFLNLLLANVGDLHESWPLFPVSS